MFLSKLVQIFKKETKCLVPDLKESNSETKSSLNRNQLLKLSKRNQQIISDFKNTAEFKKYGTKIQQGIIYEWLKAQCNNENHVRILKEVINQYYKIETCRNKNFMLTIC